VKYLYKICTSDLDLYHTFAPQNREILDPRK